MKNKPGAAAATKKRDARFPHIVRVPDVVGGEPIIDGTRIPVRTIVLYYREYQNVADLHEVYPVLDRPVLEEALRFYEANRDEIDRYITEDEAALEG